MSRGAVARRPPPPEMLASAPRRRRCGWPPPASCRSGRLSSSRSADHVLHGGPGRLGDAFDRSRRSQPEAVAGWVETMISSGLRSRDRVHRRDERVRVADLAARLEPASRSSDEREVEAYLGGIADRLDVDHRARGRPLWGTHQADHATLPRLLREHARAARRPPSVSLATTRISHQRSALIPAWPPCPTAGAGADLPAPAGAKMPCTAPGTPYS